MKKILNLILILFVSFSVKSQINCDLNYGTDSTLDIVTWNIERFPKQSSTTVNYVSQIITDLNVDILALQEIQDVDALNQVHINTGYSVHATTNSYKDLAFVYNPDVIKNVTFEEILSGGPYFTSNPMLMSFSYAGQNYVLINNHLKCCGDGYLDLSNSNDEETRRYLSCNAIKNYIDTYYPTSKVIVVGDMNDILTDSYENNVFRNILSDSTNYKFADMSIATGSYENWSYPSPDYIEYRSHIDHILITNELFGMFDNGASAIKTIKIDSCITGGWNTYDNDISDHRPVGIKLNPKIVDRINENILNSAFFKISPNPASNVINFYFYGNNHDNGKIQIYNIEGQMIKSIDINKAQLMISIDTKDLNQGLYIARYFSKTMVVQKYFVIKK